MEQQKSEMWRSLEIFHINENLPYSLGGSKGAFTYI